MKQRHVALGAVLALVLAAGCTSGGADPSGGSPTPSSGEPWRGGTLRLMANFWPTRDLDPAAYLSAAWEVYRCCLLRTLMSYNGRPAVDGGSEALPDLAASVPEVSSDGLTWTFRLREGLRYAPPFEDAEIVAQDIVRAMERIPPPDLYEYGFYYSVIDGFDAYRAGEAGSIRGLETPDPHTLIVRLNRQVGDLPYRMAMPATAPIPEGALEGHERDYFAHLVASGPYMIEGAEDLDFSLPPDEQPPVAGYTPQEEVDRSGELTVGLRLVRNPAWEPESDQLRAAYVDRMEFVLVPTDQLFRPSSVRTLDGWLQAGTLDFMLLGSAAQLQRYRADPELAERIIVAPQNDLLYLPMNVAVPPFDDIEVRRAVNLAIDKEAIAEHFLELVPNAETPTPIGHLFPDGAEGALIPSDWRPSWASGVGSHGDVDAARRAMARSAYDGDGDGRCDAPACRDVRTLIDDDWYGPGVDYSWFWKQVRDDLSAIGIRVHPVIRSSGQVLRMAGRPDAHVALIVALTGGSWTADFPNASGYAQPMLHGASIAARGNSNPAMLGATEDQLRGFGYRVTSVPSLDERIDVCLTLVGRSQTECWADLDRYAMEDVVPWVPLFTGGRIFLISDRVSSWSLNELSHRPAYDRIALVPDSE